MERITDKTERHGVTHKPWKLGMFGWPATATMIHSPMFHADNPVVQTCFTADPAPLVHNGTVYLYTGHDEDDATGFKMFDWKCFTSTDMVNWTDRGAVVSTETFSWAVKNSAWASQCVYRNGKFYFYSTAAQKRNGTMSIGVAVSDSPTGPFVDALGKPLISNSREDIDPNRLSDGNHPGIIDFMGKTDVSGFNHALDCEISPVKRERRSVCLVEMSYNADGTIQKLPCLTKEGVAQVGMLKVKHTGGSDQCETELCRINLGQWCQRSAPDILWQQHAGAESGLVKA